jgi:hypothetical protein
LHKPGLAHPNIQAQHLSNSTTTLLQKFNQGIITIFATPSTIFWMQLRKKTALFVSMIA